MESRFVRDTRLLLMTFAFFLVLHKRNAWSCPSYCECQDSSCIGNNTCLDSTEKLYNVNCYNFSDEVLEEIPQNVTSLTLISSVNDSLLQSLLSSNLTNLKTLSLLLPGRVEVNQDKVLGIGNLLHLNLSHGALQKVPNFINVFPALRTLNLSHNSILGTVNMKLSHSELETLDISGNEMHEFSLTGELDLLETVLLNDNRLYNLPIFESLTHIRVLDISGNAPLFDESGDWDADAGNSLKYCTQILPISITKLFLRKSGLWKIPDKQCGPLAGLKRLEYLYLESNLIMFLNDDEFSADIYRSLLFLSLDNNKLQYLSPTSFDKFERLRYLSVKHNSLGSIPVHILEHIGMQMAIPNASDGIAVRIEASNNRFSCDCTKQEMVAFLKQGNVSQFVSEDDFICSYPRWLYGMRLSYLSSSELQCYDVVVKKPKNISCHEYDDCGISCVFDGLPHPMVYWVSPLSEEISPVTLVNDANLRSSYILSDDGQKLTISNMQYAKTGIYKCVANNSQSSDVGHVQVGVILAPVGSIVAIVVSAVSFLVAIILNSVNLCHYYCQHLEDKRALREAEARSFKSESPLKSKQIGLHESEASLNANKYYRKYDFTCQQVFLDTVIKGAHTVKRTLYDAKHSGFSNNVWEYASHLRDRLHIELPSSVQFPRVSMPSLSMPTISMPNISIPSMPNISMPSMPNFQSINTNIEKLGTSVMHRSHNLATSVGSVFTLRWLRSANSDNESDSDLDQAGFAEVRVHVHKGHDDVSSQESRSSTESFPTPQRLSSTLPDRGAGEPSGICRDRAANSTHSSPRRTKSVRFSDEKRPMSRLKRSASITVLPQRCEDQAFVSEVTSPLMTEGSPTSEVTVDISSSTELEVYQYETTV